MTKREKITKIKERIYNLIEKDRIVTTYKDIIAYFIGYYEKICWRTFKYINQAIYELGYYDLLYDGKISR